MSRLLVQAALLSAAVALPQAAGATVFQVFPVAIEANGDARAGHITINNGSAQPVTLQVRLFRWTQVDGRDVLTPTTDVVASPPALVVPGGQKHIVRVVRTAKSAMAGEEAYRLLIDELPDPREDRPGGVRLLLRQSLPVFFGSSPRSAPATQWKTVRGADGWQLVAANKGPRRQRLSNLVVKDAAGAILQERQGLAGYVLSGSEMRWPLKSAATSPVELTISASSDAGPVHVDLGAPPGP